MNSEVGFWVSASQPIWFLENQKRVKLRLGIVGERDRSFRKIPEGYIMEVTINLPEDVAKVFLGSGDNLEREVLEATALEGYRERKLSQAQVRRMLGFATDMQTDAFLKEHSIYLEYDLQDIQRETDFTRYMK